MTREDSPIDYDRFRYAPGRPLPDGDAKRVDGHGGSITADLSVKERLLIYSVVGSVVVGFIALPVLLLVGLLYLATQAFLLLADLLMSHATLLGWFAALVIIVMGIGWSVVEVIAERRWSS